MWRARHAWSAAAGAVVTHTDLVVTRCCYILVFTTCIQGLSWPAEKMSQMASLKIFCQPVYSRQCGTVLSYFSIATIAFSACFPVSHQWLEFSWKKVSFSACVPTHVHLLQFFIGSENVSIKSLLWVSVRCSDHKDWDQASMEDERHSEWMPLIVWAVMWAVYGSCAATRYCYWAVHDVSIWWLVSYDSKGDHNVRHLWLWSPCLSTALQVGLGDLNRVLSLFFLQMWMCV